MCKQIIIFASTLSLVSNYEFPFMHLSVKTNTDIKVKCPSGNHWFLRAKSFCLSVEQYTCLLDFVNNVDKENCNGPKTEPPGDKTVVNSGNFDTESCSLDRFQLFSFFTSQGNNCVYKKTMCNEEWQLIYSNGTSVNDRKCRCDYTKNFSFVSTKRVDMCSCDPTNEDCSCCFKLCSVGQILTPGKINVKIYYEFSVFAQDQNTKTEEYKSKYRIHKAKLESYKNQPYEFRVLKDLIEDGTIETYDFPENTIKLNTAQSEEERALQNLFEKYKSEYIICRRKVEQNHATVMEE
ncbi:unnamed protein product [Mytilus coruscus]|uniref:Uncharacterized protein n=1 Tax=Mytilus coruscus TaxID=42192 RepID=A0A6J8F137_MYTCO|nr:unnamed protein product [Mytilus coruscus]